MNVFSINPSDVSKIGYSLFCDKNINYENPLDVFNSAQDNVSILIKNISGDKNHNLINHENTIKKKQSSNNINQNQMSSDVDDFIKFITGSGIDEEESSCKDEDGNEDLDNMSSDEFIKRILNNNSNGTEPVNQKQEELVSHVYSTEDLVREPDRPDDLLKQEEPSTSKRPKLLSEFLFDSSSNTIEPSSSSMEVSQSLNDHETSSSNTNPVVKPKKHHSKKKQIQTHS